MKLISDRPQSGFSIVEVVVSISLFSMGMLVVLGSLNTATSQSKSSISKVKVSEEGATLVPRLEEILNESAIEHIDTAARIVLANDGIRFQTDRFSSFSLRQCPSPTCGFHTQADLSTTEKNLICGHEHRDGMGFGGVTRGKNYPADSKTCSYDGSQLRQSATLDGIKVLSARANGEFQTRDGLPHWSSILFIFPRANDEGLCDLTVTELRVADLIESGIVQNSWTRWDNDSLNFQDLLDFGTDGTTNGVPDGKAPVCIDDCDASYERFVMITGETTQNVVFEKVLGSSQDDIYRRAEIEIDLETGTMNFHFEHKEGPGISWSSMGVVTRAPRVLGTRLSEFAVSTQTSSPIDEDDNPLGLDSSVVRVSVGTTHKKVVSQVESLDHHVETIRVFPKN